MPHATLTITIPRTVWMSDVSRAHPDTTVRVLAATANSETGVARIELCGSEPGAVVEEIRASETVTAVTVFESEPGRRLVRVETTVPLLFTSLQEAGVAPEFPVTVTDGTLTLSETIPQETLSALGRTFDAVGISYTVDRVQQSVESTPLLTDRQRWVMDEAVDRGYYDTPRRTTLVELAASLDIAKSTCSELLHRAEERVIKARRDEDGARRPAPASAAD